MFDSCSDVEAGQDLYDMTEHHLEITVSSRFLFEMPDGLSPFEGPRAVRSGYGTSSFFNR